MATLLDAIQGLGGAGQPAAPAAAPAQSETEKARQLIAGRTGKASSVAGTGAPAQSNIGEQMANQATQQQLGQVAQQNQVAQSAAAGQAQEIQQGQQQVQQAAQQTRQLNKLQMQMQANQILQQASQEGRKLDMQKDAAAVEQLGANLRLSTKSYTDQLAQEGATSRLNNELGFKQALARDAFGSSEELLRTKLGNQDVLSANKRDFDKALQDMDLETALGLEKQKARDDARRKQWEAIGGLAKQGISSYFGGGN